MAAECPPTAAENRVGDPPKSESEPCWPAGTCQASCLASPFALSRTTDTESPPGPFPVVAKTVCAPALTAALLQMLGATLCPG